MTCSLAFRKWYIISYQNPLPGAGTGLVSFSTVPNAAGLETLQLNLKSFRAYNISRHVDLSQLRSMPVKPSYQSHGGQLSLERSLGNRCKELAPQEELTMAISSLNDPGFQLLLACVSGGAAQQRNSTTMPKEELWSSFASGARNGHKIEVSAKLVATAVKVFSSGPVLVACEYLHGMSQSFWRF